MLTSCATVNTRTFWNQTLLNLELTVSQTQGLETRVDSQKNLAGFLDKPTWKNRQKTTQNLIVSFLVLLITKDFIMFKVLEKL